MGESRHTQLNRKWILIALMAAMTLAAMDSTIVATAIPQIVGDLGGFALFSWLFSIYLLIQTITIPIYGKLADIYGRKPILIFGIAVFLLGSTACGGAWNMLSLIVFRGVQALGAGAIMATINTIAGDIYSIEERAKIQGWLSSVWGASAILGPAVGGAFADYASWRWIFFINIPFGLAAIYIIHRFFDEIKPERSHAIDWKGAVAMLVTGVVIMFGIMQGGRSWPWYSVHTAVWAVLGFLLVYLTIRIEKKSEEPILPGWVWKKRVILGANLGTIGMGMIMMAPNMYLPVFAQSVTGVSAMAAGFILASMSMTWPITSSLSGRLYLRIGFRNTALCGILLVILGSAAFFPMEFPGSVPWLVGVQLLLGAGFGLISTPLLVGVQSTVTWKQRGVVTGTSMFSRYFGQSVGAAVFAAVFNATILGRLKEAPAQLKSALPEVNDLADAALSGEGGAEVSRFLRTLFFEATHNVYIGMTIIGLITLMILLRTPAVFPQPEGED